MFSLDNVSVLPRLQASLLLQFRSEWGVKKDMGRRLGWVPGEECRSRKRNMFSNIYRNIIYITGMAIFHLKCRIYLKWETAEIYKSLTVPWLNSAV